MGPPAFRKHSQPLVKALKLTVSFIIPAVPFRRRFFRGMSEGGGKSREAWLYVRCSKPGKPTERRCSRIKNLWREAYGGEYMKSEKTIFSFQKGNATL
jgi:hypothetical protein